jgi:hypothetical protein
MGYVCWGHGHVGIWVGALRRRPPIPYASTGHRRRHLRTPNRTQPKVVGTNGSADPTFMATCFRQSRKAISLLPDLDLRDPVNGLRWGDDRPLGIPQSSVWICLGNSLIPVARGAAVAFHKLPSTEHFACNGQRPVLSFRKPVPMQECEDYG